MCINGKWNGEYSMQVDLHVLVLKMLNFRVREKKHVNVYSNLCICFGPIVKPVNKFISERGESNRLCCWGKNKMEDVCKSVVHQTVIYFFKIY